MYEVYGDENSPYCFGHFEETKSECQDCLDSDDCRVYKEAETINDIINIFEED